MPEQPLTIYVPDGGSVECAIEDGVLIVPACDLSWNILDAEVLDADT